MDTLSYAELVTAMIFPEFLESWKQCSAWHFLGCTGAVLNWVQLRTLSRLAWDESEESNGYITVLLVFRTVNPDDTADGAYIRFGQQISETLDYECASCNTNLYQCLRIAIKHCLGS